MFLDAADDFAWCGEARCYRAASGDRRTSWRQGHEPAASHRAYLNDAVQQGEAFKLHPDRALFVLSEEGFYTPLDWRLTLLVGPQLWFNWVMAAIHAALEPFALRPN